MKIIRKIQQRLSDITLENVRKQGFETLEEFKEAYIEINGNWTPDQLVWVYVFERAASK